MAQLGYQLTEQEKQEAVSASNLIPAKTEAQAMVVKVTPETFESNGQVINKLDIQMKIVDGPYKNRNLFPSILMIRSEQLPLLKDGFKTAKHISDAAIVEIETVLGTSFLDTDQIMDKIFNVRIGISKNKDPKYPDQNTVTSWNVKKKAVASAPQAQPQAAPVQQPAQEQAEPAQQQPVASSVPPAFQ